MRERALDHKCPSCGAKIVFVPELGKWKCDNCKSDFDLETLQKYNNASSEENNKSEIEEVDTSFVEYHCKNCGAKIVADENTASTFCVYCGNTAILKSKLSGKFTPSKIIPFKKSKDDALLAFKNISKGRPLMPKFFNKQENIEKISGVYIPFWLFSIKTNGKFDISATKVTTWRAGNTMYTKTDKYSLTRDVDMVYDRIPVDGSTRFDDDIMASIEPFNYKDMVDYNHAYLSGFLAEKYDVESKDALKNAESRAEKTTKDKVLDSVSGYASRVITKSDINNKIQSTEYVMLPVWMVNVKYKDKFYTFAMNAQTGKFIGDIPVSTPRLIIFSVLIFLAVFAVVMIGSYLIHLGGM